MIAFLRGFTWQERITYSGFLMSVMIGVTYFWQFTCNKFWLTSPVQDAEFVCAMCDATENITCNISETVQAGKSVISETVNEFIEEVRSFIGDESK
ncbi:MAG: hypothetical protein ABFQ53_02195 [Patescibacteria group bacterium]